MPSICWRCDSPGQTVSGVVIGRKFQTVKMNNSPHHFESHPHRTNKKVIDARVEQEGAGQFAQACP